MKTCIGRYDGASSVRQIFMLTSAFAPFARRKIENVYDLTIYDYDDDDDEGRDRFDAFEEALDFCRDVTDFEYPDWSYQTVAALRRHVIMLIKDDEIAIKENGALN